ncbi:MAG TPA: hypothetical protein DCG49_11200 [Ruminococcus sp.]|nr:hypothetical protein [Ruminococcus sp.]
MKIKPVQKKKIPRYAAALAALSAAAATLCGCAEHDVQISGKMVASPPESEVELSGDVAIETEPVQCAPDDQSETNAS